MDGQRVAETCPKVYQLPKFDCCWSFRLHLGHCSSFWQFIIRASQTKDVKNEMAYEVEELTCEEISTKMSNAKNSYVKFDICVKIYFSILYSQKLPHTKKKIIDMMVLFFFW